jgi:hypothetical protein
MIVEIDGNNISISDCHGVVATSTCDGIYLSRQDKPVATSTTVDGRVAGLIAVLRAGGWVEDLERRAIRELVQRIGHYWNQCWFCSRANYLTAQRAHNLYVTKIRGGARAETSATLWIVDDPWYAHITALSAVVFDTWYSWAARAIYFESVSHQRLVRVVTGRDTYVSDAVDVLLDSMSGPQIAEFLAGYDLMACGCGLLYDRTFKN